MAELDEPAWDLNSSSNQHFVVEVEQMATAFHRFGNDIEGLKGPNKKQNFTATYQFRQWPFRASVQMILRTAYSQADQGRANKKRFGILVAIDWWNQEP